MVTIEVILLEMENSIIEDDNKSF